MNNNDITFSNYFHNWLYGKNGYYSNYQTIGKGGDFYTAVSSSRFFGGAIAKRALDIIEENFLPIDTTIIEIGGHHGYLLADIIQFIFTLKRELIKTLKFAIVERYEHLRKKQKEYFYECFGDEVILVHYNNISELKLESAFVVANEIYDTFPCELVYKNKVLQKAIVEKNQIKFIDNDDIQIEKYCKKYNVQKGEVAVGYESFALQLSQNIEKFEFITFDYGEKYPRNDFSCRVYEKHSVFPIFDKDIKLEEMYQKSDITYDVNFQHIIDSFEDIGVKNISFKTQLKALVSFGIIELLEILHNNADEKTYLSELNKVKTLLNPTGMGDRFKMASFRKNK
jgi:SAM-dependent MidA family methyltransferase